MCSDPMTRIMQEPRHSGSIYSSTCGHAIGGMVAQSVINVPHVLQSFVTASYVAHGVLVQLQSRRRATVSHGALWMPPRRGAARMDARRYWPRMGWPAAGASLSV